MFRFGAMVLLGTWLATLVGPRQAGAQCAYTTLTSGLAVSAATTPQPCVLNQGSGFWTAIGVRPAAGSDWNIEVDQSSAASPACVASPLASSARTSGVDFVIGDFNAGHDPLGLYYPLATRVGGTGGATVEWDGGANSLVVNGPLVSRTTDATDVLEVWDIALTAGTTYVLKFNRTGADARLLLFKSGAGTYWVGRSAALLEVTSSTTFTPSSSGFYGIMVINDDGLAGSYALGVQYCAPPDPLVSGSASGTSGFAERYYSFEQKNAFWTAVGVRGTGADWNLEAYGDSIGGAPPVCLGTPLASSSLGAPAVDFIVGNFNGMVSSKQFVRAHMNNDQGSGSATVEWDDGGSLQDNIILGDPPIHRTTGPSDVLECWDVYLGSGQTYQVYFNTTGANLKLFLFDPGVTWAGRSSAVLQRTGSATSAPYVPSTTGAFGVVVVNEDGQAGSYDLGISGLVVAVADEGPRRTSLESLSPNPARGDVRIRFGLREPGLVGFQVLDVAGRVVSEVPERPWQPGRWGVDWSSGARGGHRLGAGVYFLRMRVAGQTLATRRFVLLE